MIFRIRDKKLMTVNFAYEMKNPGSVLQLTRIIGSKYVFIAFEQVEIDSALYRTLKCGKYQIGEKDKTDRYVSLLWMDFSEEAFTELFGTIKACMPEYILFLFTNLPPLDYLYCANGESGEKLMKKRLLDCSCTFSYDESLLFATLHRDYFDVSEKFSQIEKMLSIFEESESDTALAADNGP